jgi:hypothetical protein
LKRDGSSSEMGSRGRAGMDYHHDSHSALKDGASWLCLVCFAFPSFDGWYSTTSIAPRSAPSRVMMRRPPPAGGLRSPNTKHSRQPRIPRMGIDWWNERYTCRKPGGHQRVDVAPQSSLSNLCHRIHGYLPRRKWSRWLRHRELKGQVSHTNYSGCAKSLASKRF